MLDALYIYEIGRYGSDESYPHIIPYFHISLYVFGTCRLKKMM